MKTYNQTLDSLGLARELFDRDNKERIERAQRLHAEMAARMREMEQLPEWQGKEFVWSKERADYLEQNPTGTEPVGAEAVMSSHNAMWLANLKRWCKEYKIGFYRMRRAIQRTEKRHKPTPDHMSHRLIANARNCGIDLERIREEYRLRKQQDAGE